MTNVSLRQRLRPVSRLIPHPVRQRLLRVWRDVVSLPARMKKGALPFPWATMHDVGGGEFYQVGRAIRDQLISEAGLKPGDHVLDIGCGTGRVAFALTDYLSAQGAYTGFDVSALGLAWMIRHMPPAAAPFRIVRADIFNTEYRQNTANAASAYRFPVKDADVDVAFATSVFTHLLPADAEHYLKEIGRTLKPGGRALVTAFLMSATRQAKMDKAFVPFFPFGPHAFVGSPKVPEAMIAFEEDTFLRWIDEAGLKLERPVMRGGWCGDAGDRFQDQMILIRPGLA